MRKKLNKKKIAHSISFRDDLVDDVQTKRVRKLFFFFQPPGMMCACSMIIGTVGDLTPFFSVAEHMAALFIVF